MKVRYPLTALTRKKKLDFLAELKDKLIERHNEKGVEFRTVRASLDSIIDAEEHPLTFVNLHWVTIRDGGNAGGKSWPGLSSRSVKRQADRLRLRCNTLYERLTQVLDNDMGLRLKVLEAEINRRVKFILQPDGSRRKERGVNSGVWNPNLDNDLR